MKTAIALFSMGGPSSLKEVGPFLFRLFNDPAIIRIAFPLRTMLAAFITAKRHACACENYKKIGGKSPLLDNTLQQARAIEHRLNQCNGEEYRCFVGMSYTKPRIAETIDEIKNYAPDRILLLPLYPQYSTTTTGSVLRDAAAAIKVCGLAQAPLYVIDQFFEEEFFTKPMAEKTMGAIERIKKHGSPKILITAHGLPLSIIKAGDPYEKQCIITAAAIKKLLPDGADVTLCYQSRVGRTQWLTPYTVDEVEKAAGAGRPIVLVPIAFVCEHAETLVELGMDYTETAFSLGAPAVEVVPTVGINDEFIGGMATHITKTLEKSPVNHK